FYVVVAVGEREASLIEVGNDRVGVVEIGRRVKREQRVGADHVVLGDNIDEIGLVLDGGDALEFWLEWIEAFGIGGLFVHTGAVVVADFLLDSAAVGATGGGFFENASLRDEVAFVEFGEADPLGLVGGDFRVLEPVAAGVLVEVNARGGGFVDRLDAETFGHLGGGWSLRKGGGGKKEQGAGESESLHSSLTVNRGL